VDCSTELEVLWKITDCKLLGQQRTGLRCVWLLVGKDLPEKQGQNDAEFQEPRPSQEDVKRLSRGHRFEEGEFRRT
jgi:hypothetical protein